MHRLSVLLAALVAVFALATPASATAPPPLGGGSHLFSADGQLHCTAGFAAVRSTNWYLITGPGCATAGATVYSGANVLVGKVVSETVVQVTNKAAWTLVPWVNAGGTRLTITGSQETPVGGAVCLYGPSTGRKCGQIIARNVTVSFPGGVVTGLTRTNICVDPGNDAVSYISGSQAQGVLIGAQGNCTSGGASYFRPVNPILAEYGLALLTG